MLVLLDVNGVLAVRVNNAELRDANLTDEHFPKVGNHRVVKRPHLDEFLDFLFDSFEHVGVWSSMRRDNIDGIVKNLMPNRTLSVVMCRQFVVERKSPGKAWDSLKPLQVLFDRHADDDGHVAFSLANTLLIDDSCLKGIANPCNVICPTTFELRDLATDSALISLVRPMLETVIDSYRAHALKLANHAAPSPPLPAFDVRDVVAPMPRCAEQLIVEFSKRHPTFPIDPPHLVLEADDVKAVLKRAREPLAIPVQSPVKSASSSTVNTPVNTPVKSPGSGKRRHHRHQKTPPQ
jgi:hypothetical protein